MTKKARESEAKALTPADMWQPGLNAIYNKIKAFILGPLLRGEMPASNVDEIFSKGGRSSGKSTATAFWIWLALENDPKKNAVIVRKVAAPYLDLSSADGVGFWVRGDGSGAILNVRVPCVTIPVGPGRNLAVILELAAMNNRQKGMGYNAAQKLADEHDRGIDLGIGF